MISNYIDGNDDVETNDLMNSWDNGWVHINHTTKKSRAWLKQQEKVSDQAKVFLLASDTRPRLVIDDESLVMCLRGINLNSDESPEDMVSIRMWMDNGSLLTSCSRNNRPINDLKLRLQAANEPKKVQGVFIAIIEELAEDTSAFIDKLDENLDHEEDDLSNNSFEEFNSKMSQLRRQIATIKRHLSPQKQSLEQLYRSKITYLDEGFYDSLYIQLDKFTHILETLDLLKERALVLQEQFMAYTSHQQNSRLYFLSIISAIFLPLTFLTGLLGMNVGGLPGIGLKYGFWYVSGFCLIATLLMLLWFKRSRWF